MTTHTSARVILVDVVFLLIEPVHDDPLEVDGAFESRESVNVLADVFEGGLGRRGLSVLKGTALCPLYSHDFQRLIPFLGFFRWKKFMQKIKS